MRNRVMFSAVNEPPMSASKHPSPARRRITLLTLTLTFVVLLIEAVLCIYQGLRGQSLWYQ